jgi:hypothetical protein
MFLQEAQFINKNNAPKFAIIDFKEYTNVKNLLSDTEKLEDYLDYLHIQKTKAKSKKSFSFEEAKKELLE